ncbi:MAG: sigma-70 family RNA polymerase sigma factor [Pirellulales bacterium]
MHPNELRELVDRHAAALELYAAQWTSAPEDCVQDALVQLIRQRHQPDDCVAWLYRVVRNRAISLARANQRRRNREATVARETSCWFEASPGARLDAKEVTAALSKIDGRYREVIVARLWGGLTYEQIGRVVKISTASAYRRYVEGLAELRDQMGIPCPNHTKSPAN